MELSAPEKVIRSSVALILAGTLSVPAAALAQEPDDEASGNVATEEPQAGEQGQAGAVSNDRSNGGSVASADETEPQTATPGQSSSDSASNSQSAEPDIESDSDEAKEGSTGAAQNVRSISTMAVAGEAQNSESGSALDAANLANGTYTATYSVDRADGAGASMANGAFTGQAVISVKDGVYSVQLTLQALSTSGVTGYIDALDAYDSTGFSGSLYAGTASGTISGTEYPQYLTYRLQDAVKASGKSPVRLHIPIMAEVTGSDSFAYQNVYIDFDWSTLVQTSTETPSDPEPATDEPTEPSGDNGSGGTSGNTSGTTGESSETTGASSGAAAAATNEVQEDYQVGHVYSVPMWITKENSSETSMANQYFGSTAYVRPQSDGTYYVDITTNRYDWITSVSYNGTACQVVSQDGNTATYRIVMKAATGTTVIPITFTVKPMNNVAQTADLHLAFANPTDKGNDSGQEPSSTNDPQVAATSGASAGVVPQTSDSADKGLVASLAGMMAVAAGGMATAVRRMRKQEER